MKVWLQRFGIVHNGLPESGRQQQRGYMKKTKQWIYFFIAVILMTALDQFTKQLALTHLQGKENFVLIPGVFELTYLQNYGAAFSSMQGKAVLLITGTILVLAFILYSYHKIPNEKKYIMLRIIFAMLTAGAIGNMIDRIINQYVIDFLYFSLINFPVFNVADCYVTISVILFAIFGFFIYREQDIEFLFHIRNK